MSDYLDECIYTDDEPEYMDCGYCEHDGKCHAQRIQQSEDDSNYAKELAFVQDNDFVSSGIDWF